MADPKKSAKTAEEAAALGACLATGCKAKGARFSFCEEHYDHYKFGLIKKNGEQVPDYEKKFQHFVDYKAKKGSRRVA